MGTQDQLDFSKYNALRKLDNYNGRRIDPLEYRGYNMSDCMYHTMQSFKNARHYQSPKNKKVSPDYNLPLGI